MDFKLVLVIASAVALIFAMMIFQPIPLVDSELYCQSDANCVADSPCHSDGCVNQNAYDRMYDGAQMMYCTADCQPGTMDCGQGSCQCISNQCEVVMNE
jgi:hypothetical protein